LVFILVAAGSGASASAPASAPAAQSEDDFTALRAALRRGDDKAASTAYAVLTQHKLAAGWPNAFVYTALLLRDAAKVADPEQALRTAEYARDLSPSSLSGHLETIKYRWALQQKDPGKIAREAWVAAKIAVSDFLTAAGFVANAAAGLIIVLLLLPTCVLLLLAVRQLRYVAHDLSLLLPRGTPAAASYAILAVLLFIPIALRLGALGVLFVLVAIPFLHEDTPERVVAAACFLVLAAMPLALPHISRLLLLPAGRAADLYVLTRGMAGDGLDADAAATRITHDLARGDNASSRVALGLYAMRTGDTAAAAHHFDRATHLAPERDDAWVDLGAAQFVLGKFDDAQAAFERAVEDNPDSIRGLFNLARMYYRNAGHDRGNQAYNRAQALRPDLVGTLLTTSRLIGPRFVAQETLPARELWRAAPYANEQLTTARITQELEPSLTGPIPPLVFAIAAVGWLVVLAFAAAMARRAVPSLPCPKCGRPICVHTDKDLPDRSLCGQCYHAFVAGDVDAVTKIAKELECLRYERRRAQLSRVLSLVFSGAGHVYVGHTLRGLTWMACAAVAIAALLLCGNVLPAPVRMGEPLLRLLGLYASLAALLATIVVAFVTVPEEN
jgi:tetratricopeptide (TPR) repeat protein